ncbi:hypothetical protein NKJ26_32700, partial [Mesorhizobium sp. M0152]
TKSRVSPQRDSRPGQLSLHQSADNFTVPFGDPMLGSQVQHVRSIHITNATRFDVDASKFWIFIKGRAPIGASDIERRSICRSENLHHLTRGSVKLETAFGYLVN